MEEKTRIPKKEEKIETKQEDVKICKMRHRQNIYLTLTQKTPSDEVTIFLVT